MGNLSDWLASQAKVSKRTRFIEDAFLSGRLAPYAWYRLRYCVLRCLCVVALHVAELGILSAALAPRALTAVVLLRVATSFATNWWWGGLESMRSELRFLRRNGKSNRIPGTIALWLETTRWAAAVALLTSASAVAVDVVLSGRRFDVAHFYVFGSGVRLAFGLLARTQHSATYSLRRIFRPLWSLVAVDWIGFAGAVVLWPLVGPWAFPTLYLFSSVARSLLTMRYAAAGFRALDLGPISARFRVPTWRFLRKNLFCRAFLGSAFSYAILSHVEAIFLLTAFSGGTEGLGMQLAWTLYAVRPLLRACSDWVHPFYFDLKRIEVEMWRHCRVAMRTMLTSLAWLSATLNWLVSLAICGLLFPSNLGTVGVLLAFLFAARALLAETHLQAYAAGRNAILCGGGGGIVVGVVGAAWLGMRLEHQLLVFSGLMLICREAIRRGSSTHRTASERAWLINQLDWVQGLASEPVPVRIRSVRLAAAVKDAAIVAFCDRLSVQMRGGGAGCLIDRRCVVWWERRDAFRCEPDPWIWRIGAGQIESLADFPWKPSGLESLRDANAAFSRLWDCGIESRDPSLDQVVRQFETMAPNGIAFALGDGKTLIAPRYGPAARRSIMWGLRHFGRNCHRECRTGGFDVTALVRDGDVTLVFVLDATTPRSDRQRWRRFVNEINLRRALAPFVLPTDRRAIEPEGASEASGCRICI